jgi:hypothetical protein
VAVAVELDSDLVAVIGSDRLVSINPDVVVETDSDVAMAIDSAVLVAIDSARVEAVCLDMGAEADSEGPLALDLDGPHHSDHTRIG